MIENMIKSWAHCYKVSIEKCNFNNNKERIQNNNNNSQPHSRSHRDECRTELECSSKWLDDSQSCPHCQSHPY